MFFIIFISFFALLFLLLSGYFTRFLCWFLVFILQLGWSIAPAGCYTRSRVAAFAASPLRAGGVLKTRVLTIFDASFIAGFGLAPAWRVWFDSLWRALSIGGTFVQIGGVFSFNDGKADKYL